MLDVEITKWIIKWLRSGHGHWAGPTTVISDERCRDCLRRESGTKWNEEAATRYYGQPAPRCTITAHYGRTRCALFTIIFIAHALLLSLRRWFALQGPTCKLADVNQQNTYYY